MPSSNTYLPVVTTLRGVAASAICFYHFVLGTAGYITEESVRTFFYYAQYGVPMFFIISAVVLPLSMFKNGYEIRHLWSFLYKRLLRLEPPYLASLILATAYLFFQIYRGSNLMDFTWTNLLLHIGYFVPFVEGEKWLNPIYWSLAVEFQFYIFLSIAFIGIKSPKPQWRFVVYILMLCSSFASVDKNFIWKWMPLFLLGILYVLFKLKKIKTIEYTLVTLMALGFIYLVLDIPNMIVAILTLGIIHNYPNFKNKWTDFLGEISYSIYLIHLIVGQAIANYLAHIYVEPFQKFLVITLAYLCSVFCAWLFYKLIERPSKKMASSIQYKPSKK